MTQRLTSWIPGFLYQAQYVKVFIVFKIQTNTDLKIKGSTIYTRRVARQYGICWLKKKTIHSTWYTSHSSWESFFLFVKNSVWFRISWNLAKFQLIQTNIQTTFFYGGNKSCLNGLIFCEVSQLDYSKRCWKFQIFILKNKKVLKQIQFGSAGPVRQIWVSSPVQSGNSSPVRLSPTLTQLATKTDSNRMTNYLLSRFIPKKNIKCTMYNG